jgi:hypothetical protein
MTALGTNSILGIVVVIIIIIIVIWIFRALSRSGWGEREGWGERDDGFIEGGDRWGGGEGDRRGRGGERRGEERGSSRREASEIGCSDCGPRPDRPTDVSCRSNESFELEVRWRHPRCHVAKYLVYLKHSDESHSSGSHSSPTHSSSSHLTKCGCQESSSSSSPSESCGCGACSSSSSSSAPAWNCQCKDNASSSSSSESRHHRRHNAHAQFEEQHEVGCGCDSCKSSSSSSSSSPSSSSSSSSSCESCGTECECGPHNYDEVIEVEGSKNFIRIIDLHARSVCVNVTAVNHKGRESYPSNCCTSRIKCECNVYPCITSSDCKGLSLRWKKVHCAKKFNIYYGDELKFTVPGDAEGARNLPALDDDSHVKVYVTTLGECGESEKQEATASCECKGSDCGRCHRCKQVKESCSCDSSSSSSSSSDHHSHHSDSSSSSSSDDHHSRHHHRSRHGRRH